MSEIWCYVHTDIALIASKKKKNTEGLIKKILDMITLDLVKNNGGIHIEGSI